MKQRRQKSRRIIYLEQRGEEKKHFVSTIVFATLAILCFLYCCSIALFMGYGTMFFLVWGAMAAVFGALSLLLAHPQWIARIPRWLRYATVICSVIGTLLFTVVEGMIMGQFNAKAVPGADYMIVLGAQWKQDGPSYVLQKRLDKAFAYLEKNPDTIVIVSGGQGGNEPITEASGMKSYLVEKGIEEERIFVEERSTNTYENLVFSGEFFEEENNTVVLVTNNFHMFRALQIAKKQGYVHIEGLSAGSHPAMVPNNLLREFFGVVKDFMVGNL